MGRRITGSFLAVASLALIGVCPSAGMGASNITVTADSMDPSGAGKQAAFSDNGMHIAFVGPSGSRSAGFIDGKAGNKYDEVGTFGNMSPQAQFIFSADGSHCAYPARNGTNKVLVVDGVETPLGCEFWEVTEGAFSPDGNQFALAVNPQAGGGSVILNNKKGPAYFKVKSLQFSSDSKHFAYIANNSDKTKLAFLAVMDGTVGPEFTDITGLTFSPDGEHWGYIGQEGNINTGAKSHLYIDGKEFAVFDNVSSFQFSPDGNHVMYIAGTAIPGKKDMASHPVYDQVIGLDAQRWPFVAKMSSQQSITPPIMSADGKRIAYVEASADGPTGKGGVVTVNGVKGAEYENISKLAFSADGQHVVYLAIQGVDKYSQGGRAFVIEDGNESDAYTMDAQQRGGLSWVIPTFSPDGKHLAYKGGDGKHVFAVYDGKKGADYDDVEPVVFSADGTHMAYFASKKTVSDNLPPIQRQQALASPNYDSGQYVVLDGVEQHLPPKTFFAGGTVHFSPDGKHVGYVVSNSLAGAMSDLVVDGKIVKFADATLVLTGGSDAAIMFTPDSKHIIFEGYSRANGIQGLGVDGELVAGYGPAVFNSSTPRIGFSDGKLVFFAHKGNGGPIFRVTVDMGPDRDFGTK